MTTLANQPLKNTEILTSIALFFVSIYFIFSTTINQFSQSTELAEAQRDTDRLSLQIAHLNQEQNRPAAKALVSSVPTRSIASIVSTASESNKRTVPVYWKDEGTIGKDPWGRPYRYKVIRDQGGNIKQVAVWTIGENSQSETNLENLSSLSDDQPNSFQGDDWGHIRSIDKKNKSQ